MTSSSNKDKGTINIVPDDNGELLEWTTHPLRRKPAVAIVVTFFIFALGFIVYYMTASKVFTILTLVVLFTSLSKFYFPTRFRLTSKGLIVKTTTQTIHKDWSNYRSCYPDKNGILLSPFAEPSRLENFRGIYLMFSNNKDEVTRFVKAHIGKPKDDASTKKKEEEDN